MTPHPARVQLFATCLVDQFFPAAGHGAVEVLERCGVEVHVPPDQTCCASRRSTRGLRETPPPWRAPRSTRCPGPTTRLSSPRAVTLILVQPQRVPGNYVRAITEGTVEDRLKTISQQVTSRTNLENITAEHKLGTEYENLRDPDELVNAVRKRIAIDVKAGRGGETSSFTIAFQAGDPETAMKVANALASNFITENLKQREEQAIGTSGFLFDELDAMRKRLAAKEEELMTVS